MKGYIDVKEWFFMLKPAVLFGFDQIDIFVPVSKRYG
jgi:hypothetical protein